MKYLLTLSSVFQIVAHTRTLFERLVLGEGARYSPQWYPSLPGQLDRTGLGSGGWLHDLGGVVVEIGICTAWERDGKAVHM